MRETETEREREIERERDENWRQVFAPNASPVIKSTDLVSQNN